MTIDTAAAQTIINNAQDNTNTVLADADRYLQNLIDITNVDFSNGFNIDNLLPSPYQYFDNPNTFFPLPGYAVRPDVTGIGTTPPPEAPTFTFSSLAGIDLPTDDLLLPTNNFAFYETAYSSILLDPLKAKLLDNLVNGGYGIETADEVALFNRARDREVEAMMSRIDDAGRAMAMRGFPLPPGELSVHIDRAYQEMQNKVSDVSRDITLQRNKLYVENRQFTIEQVKSVEQILIGFHNLVQERAFNVAKATAEFVLTYFNTLVARYNARLAAAKITSEVQFQRIQTEAERARAYIAVFEAQTRAYEANLRRLIDSAKLRVDVYGQDINMVKVQNDAAIAQSNLSVKTLEGTRQLNMQVANLAVETVKAKLQATVDALRFRTAGVQFGSEKFFALVTAMQTSINGLGVVQQ